MWSKAENMFPVPEGSRRRCAPSNRQLVILRLGRSLVINERGKLRRIVVCFEQGAENFLGMLHLGFALILLRVYEMAYSQGPSP